MTTSAVVSAPDPFAIPLPDAGRAAFGTVDRIAWRRHRGTVASVDQILRPRSVAIVGGADPDGQTELALVAALQASRFTGRLYVVDPTRVSLHGVTTIASARDLPSSVDLALVTAPIDAVLTTIDDCAAAGVGAVLVMTSGFAEHGDRGRALEEVLVERVRDYGMRVVGPNSLGVLNLDPVVNLAALTARPRPPAGHIALASHGGAFAGALLDLMADRGLGLSSYVSLGNRADVSSNDLLEYWEDDAQTRHVLLYLESFGNLRRFAAITRRMTPRKPVVAMRATRLTSGARAFASGLASAGSVVNEVLEQAGVIRADSVDELFDIAACLDTAPLPDGPRVAIVTNASGAGLLAGEACLNAGLIPAAPVMHVPASASAEAFNDALVPLLEDARVDAVIAIDAPAEPVRSVGVVPAIGAALASARRRGRAKPLLACVGTRKRRAGVMQTEGARVPVYLFPEHAARALGKVVEYARQRSRH